MTPDKLMAAAKKAMAAGDRPAARRLMQAAYEAENAADPSAGGGTLQIGLGDSIDTGIETPEWLDRGLAGTGRGIANVVRHAGNLVGAVSDDDLREAKRLDQPLLDTTSGSVGNFIGETAMTALPAMGTTAAVARLGSTGARIASNMIGRGALEGAAQSALMADPDQSRLFEAVKGAGFGAAIPAALKGGSKVARGLSRTPEAQRLLDAGVSLTPGQMNPSGLFSAAEQIAPFAQLARGARTGAKRDWNRAVAEAAAAPGTKIADGPMDSMLDAAYKSFEPLYDQAKGFPIGAKIVRTQGPDIPLSQAFAGVARTAGTTTNVQKAADKWLKSQLSAKMAAARQRGGMTSDDLLDLRSKLREEIRSFNKATDADSKHFVRIYQKAEEKLTDALDSQLPPDAMAANRLADQHYVEYKNLEDAVFRSTTRDTGPTPHELLSALKASASTKGSFARGANPNQRLRQLAEDAAVSFAEDPRGKTGASLLMAAPLTAAMLAKPWVGIPAAIGATGLTLTDLGRRTAAGQLGPQQTATAALNRLQSRLNPTSANLANEYAQRALLTYQNEE